MAQNYKMALVFANIFSKICSVKFMEMEDCSVTVAGKQIIIERMKQPFKMRVAKNELAKTNQNTALLEATLYKEDGVFVKNGSYLFEALDSDNQPVTEVDIDAFKSAVDFFLTSVVGTEHYVKSIPKASSLCHQEMRLFGF